MVLVNSWASKTTHVRLLGAPGRTGFFFLQCLAMPCGRKPCVFQNLGAPGNWQPYILRCRGSLGAGNETFYNVWARPHAGKNVSYDVWVPLGAGNCAFYCVLDSLGAGSHPFYSCSISFLMAFGALCCVVVLLVTMLRLDFICLFCA